VSKPITPTRGIGLAVEGRLFEVEFSVVDASVVAGVVDGSVDWDCAFMSEEVPLVVELVGLLEVPEGCCWAEATDTTMIRASTAAIENQLRFIADSFH
jgi:hypothetical protein